MTIFFRGGSMTSGEIAGRFSSKWPTTTRHLNALTDAGLVTAEKRGRTRVYTLEAERLDILREWLAWFESEPG